ncbi:MAG: hypothetical protein KF889_20560 [Alphaproteobacteria bacterium]|nr:hypothetical protein [Alphaproteobacteria bacterium]MCW5744249.1 hypothetical protein [Alphaproteobacteria bacterium]
MKRLGLAALMSLSLALGACGDNPMDRGLSGAGMGAGAGMLGGLLVGAPLEGALLGAVVGGAAGALTQRNQVDFGRPMWR